MESSTIWESASRPLFLRSVWLETSNARRRSHQRHFILDYDSQVQERQLRLNSSPLKRKRDSLKYSPSPQYSLTDEDDTLALESHENLLIGSGKVKLHRPFSPGNVTKSNHYKCSRRSHHRRQSLLHNKYKHPGYDYMRTSQSRRSSLQDLQSNMSHTNSSPDERLAERVLNWLDLAGKTDFLKPQDDNAATDQKKSRTSVSGTQNKRRNSLIARGFEASQRNFLARRNSMSSKKKKSLGASGCQHGRYDSVKHITIIFNKEGVPVRFNRPARNIDLCALSSSPNTIRRMAGPLASARLYKSTDGIMTTTPSVRPSTKCSTARKAGPKVEEFSAAEKNASGGVPGLVSFEDTTQCGVFNDSKKQLHIFMPSLPKKSAIVASSDDATSALSHTFSELCKV